MARDRDRAEVDAGSQCGVQPHLLVAQMTAPLEAAAVHEPHADVLLDLVDAIAGEKDERDVCLDQFDGIGPAGVGLGPQERLHEARVPHLFQMPAFACLAAVSSFMEA